TDHRERLDGLERGAWQDGVVHPPVAKGGPPVGSRGDKRRPVDGLDDAPAGHVDQHGGVVECCGVGGLGGHPPEGTGQLPTLSAAFVVAFAVFAAVFFAAVPVDLVAVRVRAAPFLAVVFVRLAAVEVRLAEPAAAFLVLAGSALTSSTESATASAVSAASLRP